MRRLLIPALLLTGCAGIPAVPAGPPSPEPVVLLLKAEARGGLCVTGSMCESQITVMSDGAWTRTGGDAARSGVLPASRVAALAEAVRRTGLASAPPFTGTCPIAYDGQEQVLTWLQDGAPVTAASCEREFDPGDPLVVAAADLSAELS